MDNYNKRMVDFHIQESIYMLLDACNHKKARDYVVKRCLELLPVMFSEYDEAHGDDKK